jgi:undecaprenyl-diphosphatase
MKHISDFSHSDARAVRLAVVPPPAPTWWTRLQAGQSGLSKAVTASLALLAFSLLADMALRDYALRADPTVKALLRQITQMGNSAWPLGIGGALWLGLAVLVQRWRGLRKTVVRRAQDCVLFVMASVALSGALASLLKQIIGRARPMTDGGAGVYQFKLLAFDPAWASFPSGHATTATAMMLALAMIMPRHAVACVAIGLLGAASRALLGVHWASDVIAGIALGTVVTLALRQRFEAGRRRGLMPRGSARMLLRCLRAALQDGGQCLITTTWHFVLQKWQANRN